MKVSLDETVFGRKCHSMKVSLDENVHPIWMKVYLTAGPPEKMATPTTECKVKLLEGRKIITDQRVVEAIPGRTDGVHVRTSREGERKTTPRYLYCWTRGGGTPKMHTAVGATAERTKDHGG